MLVKSHKQLNEGSLLRGTGSTHSLRLSSAQSPMDGLHSPTASTREPGHLRGKKPKKQPQRIHLVLGGKILVGISRIHLQKSTLLQSRNSLTTPCCDGCPPLHEPLWLLLSQLTKSRSQPHHLGLKRARSALSAVISPCSGEIRQGFVRQ